MPAHQPPVNSRSGLLTRSVATPSRPPPHRCPQVHRATLHSGEQVVVKVQRPGLRQLFEIDLQVWAVDGCGCHICIEHPTTMRRMPG